jgi:PadR family transcriptional regulator PadR
VVEVAEEEAAVVAAAQPAIAESSSSSASCSDSSIAIPYVGVYHGFMSSKADVWQGTLALMVLKTLERTGSLHGYGIARQIERTSADLLSLNYGTLYPALLKLEQEGCIASEWGFSENNRKAKFYQLTRAGRKQLEKETQGWEQTTAILARFLTA